ncbi:MAG: hypothetical protein RR350_01945 [Oscillibacter sp.]
MLFKAQDSSLQLEISHYEFPADGGTPGSDDRNWLVLRGTYTEGDLVVKDSNSCLLTYELREMTAGLKVLNAGIKDAYGSDFVEPFFEVSAQAAGEDCFALDVSFALPNTLEDLDTAEFSGLLTRKELTDLIEELDKACEKFPDRD